jgi:hypothetical protein
MAESITLGDFKTESEAREKENKHKKRLKDVIKLNKLKVSPASFKFSITKEKAPNWLHEELKYPYNLSVEVPSQEYLWIFQV